MADFEMDTSARDEELQTHKAYIRQLTDVCKTLNSKVNSAFAAIEDALKAFEAAQKAFDQVIAVGVRNEQLNAASLHFGRQLALFKEATLPKTRQSYKTECQDPLHNFLEDTKRIDDARHEAKKLAEDYDSARKAVYTKEQEYLKKGRPLSESKEYPKNKQKLEEVTPKYEAALTQFRLDYVEFQGRKEAATAHIFQCFLEHGTTMLGGLEHCFSQAFHLTNQNTHRPMDMAGTGTPSTTGPSTPPPTVPNPVPASVGAPVPMTFSAPEAANPPLDFQGGAAN